MIDTDSFTVCCFQMSKIVSFSPTDIVHPNPPTFNAQKSNKKQHNIMLPNVVAVAPTIMISLSSLRDIVFGPEDLPFGTVEWFVYAGLSCLLVIFAGIMSGLTLGLMSLGLVELEILQSSGTIVQKKQVCKTLRLLLLLVNDTTSLHSFDCK